MSILRSIRKLQTLLRLLLERDQQLLLEMKRTKYISSEHETEPYLLKGTKKKLNKSKLLSRYIDNIKSKHLNETDMKLLKLLGFERVIPSLTRSENISESQNWFRGSAYIDLYGREERKSAD